jgi:hypothetical protein
MDEIGVCEDAGGYDECMGDVIYTPDPYLQELYDEIVMVWLCGRHYHDRYMEV